MARRIPATYTETSAAHTKKLESSLKANSHIACCTHAVPLPYRLLIHTCHAAPLPCSDSAVSFVKVHVVAGNIRTVVQQFNRLSVL
jgi:hypothetical protein